MIANVRVPLNATNVYPAQNIARGRKEEYEHDIPVQPL